MFIAMVVVFIVGYTFIALEHPIKVDKAASALLTSVVLWILFLVGAGDILPGNHFFREFLQRFPEYAQLPKHEQYLKFIVDHEIIEHLGEIADPYAPVRVEIENRIERRLPQTGSITVEELCEIRQIDVAVRVHVARQAATIDVHTSRRTIYIRRILPTVRRLRGADRQPTPIRRQGASER